MTKSTNILDLVKLGIETELSEHYDKQVEIAVGNLENYLKGMKRVAIMKALDSLEMRLLEEPNGMNKFEVTIRKEN